MPRFLSKKKSEETIAAQQSFAVNSVRRTTHSAYEDNFKGTPPAVAPHTLAPPRTQLAQLATVIANDTSSVAAGKQPVARDYFQRPGSSNSVRTPVLSNIRKEEERRAYRGLPKEDHDALASGEINHNLMPYTPEVAIEKQKSREVLRPNFSTAESGLNARVRASSQHVGQRFTQEHRPSSAVANQPQHGQPTSHYRSFTEPTPQLSLVSHGISHSSSPLQSAPQLPPTVRIPSSSYGVEEYLQTTSTDYTPSLPAAPGYISEHTRTVGNEDNAVQRGRPTHRPVSQPAHQLASQRSAASSRLRSPLSGQWDPSSSDTSQSHHTRHATDSNFFAPQPLYPEYESLNPHPISPASSRVRSPLGGSSQAPSTPPSAGSSRVQTPASVHKHNPSITFDDFVAPHKSGKGETFWNNANAKQFKLSKEVGNRARSESRASNETSSSQSSFRQVRDKIAKVVRSPAEPKDSRSDNDDGEASQYQRFRRF